MTDAPEFIVESVDTSDETWKFFNNIQDLKETRTLNDGIPKKFTSMATNATIFRWKFGDQQGNPTIQTTVNPYIHTFQHNGTYNVSHQSCYPCLSTNSLICSNGWCTKSIEVQKEHEEERGSDSLVACAGLAGLFIIISEDNCCDLRKRCAEKRAICATIKPQYIENTEVCKSIDKLCTIKLKDCEKKCIKTGHTWKPLPYKCIEKHEPYKEICQVIEKQKRYRKNKK